VAAASLRRRANIRFCAVVLVYNLDGGVKVHCVSRSDD